MVGVLRADEYRSMDARTDRKMMWIEFVLVLILIGISLTAVILIIMGLGNDLTSGNRSFEVQVQRGVAHQQPTFTFCPLGDSENTLPRVGFCGYNSFLDLRSQADQEREWGNETTDCVTAMRNEGIDIWSVHPLASECWVLSNDVQGQLIPERTPEVMYIEFEAEGIVMRLWNESFTALAEQPTNSSAAQGLRAIFGAGDILQMTEGFVQRLGGPRETSYELVESGSFPLVAVGETNVSIVALSWATDSVTTTREKETVSLLTLIAIVLAAVVVVVELIFRNFVLLSYMLFFYVPVESTGNGKGEHLSDPYGTIRGKKQPPADVDPADGLKPNPAAGWDEGVLEA